MMDEEYLDQVTAVLNAGDVEYALPEAVVPLQELIDSLLEAQAEGVEYVVLPSGNTRGAKWVKLSAGWDWASEE